MTVHLANHGILDSTSHSDYLSELDLYVCMYMYVVCELYHVTWPFSVHISVYDVNMNCLFSSNVAYEAAVNADV